MEEKVKDSCFYCGDDTQEIHRDHVKPISMQSSYRNYDEKDTVKCCRECNSLLSNNLFITLEDRARNLIEIYEKRYRKCLNTPHWDEYDLEQLGPRMRSKVEANVVQKEYITQRLSTLSKTAASFYDYSQADKLRGIVTDQKVIAYNIIMDYVRTESRLDDFLERWSAHFDVSKEWVRRIVNEKEMIDVSLTFKLDRGISLDIPLNKYKAALKKALKKGERYEFR